MVAFNCDYVSGEMRADGVELEDAGWFTADRLPRIPAPGSIAWEMIADFARKHAVELQ